MTTEFSRMIIVTAIDGSREAYPLTCRQDAINDLAINLYFDVPEAYNAFKAWAADLVEPGEDVDPDDSGAFSQWTDYKAIDMIDEAMKSGRSAAFDVAVEITDDERPYEVDADGIVYTDARALA